VLDLFAHIGDLRLEGGIGPRLQDFGGDLQPAKR
jgi:hypothetical protein